MNAADQALLERRVRVAARALGRHGLVQAWGHCSARIDEHAFLVCAPRPMGCIAPDECGTVVQIDQPLPAGVLGEVRIHQQIYKRRADVGGVCRVMPPHVMALSTLRQVPQPRHGVGAFNAACRFWDDPRLLRDDGLAAKLAQRLGDAPSIVMRANGAVTVGPCVELAAGLAWCLEDAARIDVLVRSMAPAGEAAAARLNHDEVGLRQVSSGAVFERLWDYLAGSDPEWVADVEFAAPHWGMTRSGGT
ncbi:MAG: class II aldolase/adducin family protein [Sinobacteraceae bacterium]|nr:class II aldolase/adducin family protein [Nevskiaceae bacterium]